MGEDKKQIKILIVDDDVRFVDHVYNRLSDYDVSVCFSGAQAKSLILNQFFHIILVDCLMPEMDGHTFAQHIQKCFGRAPAVILMSGVFQESDMLFPDLINVAHILKKPFLKHQLEEAIEKAKEKIFTSSENYNLSPILTSGLNREDVDKKIKKITKLREGDILLLFFHLLRSEFKGTLRLYDGGQEARISFSNKYIVDVYDENKEQIREFFTKNNILSQREIEPYLNLKYKEMFEKLMERSLISPHHLILYKTDQLTSCLSAFSKKTSFQIQFMPLESSSIKLHYTEILNPIAAAVETNLSDTYLQQFFNQMEPHPITIDTAKNKDWRQKNLPILMPITSKMNDLYSCRHLYQFFNLFSNNKTDVMQAVFWLMTQNFIQIEPDQHEDLEKLYVRYYNYIHQLFKSYNYENIFKELGCKDAQNASQLKSIYHRYMKMNHVNNFNEFGKQLQKIVSEVTQMVTEAYHIIANKDKQLDYKKRIHIEAIKKNMKIEEKKYKIYDLVRTQKYPEALAAISEVESIPDLDETSKIELFLWSVVIEIEQMKHTLSNKKLKAIRSEIQTIKNERILSSALYFYTMGMLDLCEKNTTNAQMYFDKALKENSIFHLAKIKKMSA